LTKKQENNRPSSAIDIFGIHVKVFATNDICPLVFMAPKQFLLREKTKSMTRLANLSKVGLVAAKAGATYTVLDAQTLESI
jgi:hypothetical protein